MVAESWMSQDKIFLILPIRLCNILMISHPPPPFNGSYLTHNFLHSPAPPPPLCTLLTTTDPPSVPLQPCDPPPKILILPSVVITGLQRDKTLLNFKWPLTKS